MSLPAGNHVLGAVKGGPLAVEWAGASPARRAGDQQLLTPLRPPYLSRFIPRALAYGGSAA
ncbi:hypothetical protein [Nonomuraea dietziae]|uniref:hypothetical protein n=1 Tax=Nonomuraea dietziae TaxID=65515 RepID=UPI0031E26DCA